MPLGEGHLPFEDQRFRQWGGEEDSQTQNTEGNSERLEKEFGSKVCKELDTSDGGRESREETTAA